MQDRGVSFGLSWQKAVVLSQKPKTLGFSLMLMGSQVQFQSHLRWELSDLTQVAICSLSPKRGEDGAWAAWPAWRPFRSRVRGITACQAQKHQRGSATHSFHGLTHLLYNHTPARSVCWTRATQAICKWSVIKCKLVLPAEQQQVIIMMIKLNIIQKRGKGHNYCQMKYGNTRVLICS